jgi:hypothetical protein
VLTCSIYNSITGLVKKEYHECKCCGPFIKARWCINLRNPVYNYLKVFLLENLSYRREKTPFNGKQHRTERLEIMALEN